MNFLKSFVATSALMAAAGSAFAGGVTLPEGPAAADTAASAVQAGHVQSARDHLTKTGVNVKMIKDATSKFLSECKPGHDSIVLFRGERILNSVVTNHQPINIEVGGYVCQDSTGKTPIFSVASTDYVKPPPKMKGP